MEKILENTLLYDFYGELLTEKQRKIFEMHFNEDLSLGEIGTLEGISRQGVFQQLKRGSESLNEYEKKLHLVEKFLKIKANLEKMTEILDKAGGKNPEINEDITKIKALAESIIDLI